MSSSLSPPPSLCSFFFFFFNDTATTEIYTLSLHDALPILSRSGTLRLVASRTRRMTTEAKRIDSETLRKAEGGRRDRKSTRLNSSHGYISYAVFCLKKKKFNQYIRSKHHRRLHYCARPEIR